MSEYSYDDRPRRHRTTREREPEYVAETTYVERGSRGAGTRDLVYRPAREDSIEDIPRDFPPPGTEFRQTKYRESREPRRTRSAHRDYDYDEYYRYDRGRRPRDYYYDSDEDNRHPRRHERRKSIVDNIKEIGEAAGLGSVIGAVTGRSRSRSRHRKDRGYDSDRYGDRYDDRRSRRYSSSERSRSRGPRRSEKKWQQAAQAAIVAGAVEAFRSRKTPGPWTGEKGQRIATAALGAAGIDSLVDKDPDRHSKRHVAESAIGGLLANRVANGPRSRSRGRDGSRSPSRSRSRSRSIFGRSRSQSRGRSGSRGRDALGKVVGSGAVLAAGKALYDRVRSKSRSRRDRSRSVSSTDSYDPPSRRRSHRSYSRGRSMDDTHSEGPRANSDRRLAAATGAGAVAAKGMNRGGSSSSESTTDIEKRRKKLRGKELLTAGLATVATIHAAHGIYSSMVASGKRRRLVAEGEMTREEARKRKSKNMLQDAAAVGIAALGIKSAFSEWKELNEHRHSVKELEERRRQRRKARERREREARQNALSMNGMTNSYTYPIAPTNPYPTTYADANPYGAVPPPPIGAPPGARY